MSNIALCLWFDGQAEDAARFYVDVFRACGRPASLGAIVPWGKEGPGLEGKVLTADFTIDGQKVLALNGGPNFTHSPAISMMVSCETQDEIDAFWARLTDGGKEINCGWLTDKFGIAWQVVPTALMEMMRDPDVAKRDRVMAAFMPMKKFDLAALQQAYAGGSDRHPARRRKVTRDRCTSTIPRRAPVPGSTAPPRNDGAA